LRGSPNPSSTFVLRTAASGGRIRLALLHRRKAASSPNYRMLQ
jgi:hypothetical protein